jgi:hypothetical protein
METVFLVEVVQADLGTLQPAADDDILVQVFLNQDKSPAQVYRLNSKHSKLERQVEISEERLRLLRFVVKNKGQVVGSVHLNRETDFSLCEYRECHTWISLFPSLELDLFEGDLGINDKQTPRIRLQITPVR